MFRQTQGIEFMEPKGRLRKFLNTTGEALSKHYLPRWIVFLFDLSTVFLAFIFAYVLRYNLEINEFDLRLALRQSMIVVSAYCFSELLFKSYAGLIRHTTVIDIFRIFNSTIVALICLLMLTVISRNRAWPDIYNVPLSILLIHFVSLNAILFIVRILVKMIYEMVTDTNTVQKKNVIIFGAGSMGLIVKRVIMADKSGGYNMVAFLDNNKRIQRKNVDGYPVISPDRLKKSFLEKYNIKTMIFAIVKIPPNEKADIYRFAVDIGLEVLEVPVVNDWINGKFNLNQLKKINVEDLLGREPIELNMKNIARGLARKRILVTGAAGSIGSEIVRQLTRFNMERMILIDNAETAMFYLENELQESFAHAPVKTILADVTDQVKMERIFREFKPEIVFHAAAYKHVPLMEENPHEAIRVNVGGTAILTKLAVKYGVYKFVNVSTDKAVNPTNVMGASKRIGELILRSRSLIPGNRTQFVITRFGNVLGSNGSVIPIFRKQIEEGGPVTVTHPDITRYFMTIPEACQLVLEAGFMGMGGEIFVFDMGEPVKISDLAKRMIKLSGYELDKDIEILYTGLRPGEKLFEELLTDNEETLPTYNPKVRTAEVAWLNYRDMLSKIHNLLYTYQCLKETDLVCQIMEIVPEFKPSNERYFGQSGSSEAIEMEVYPD